MLTLVVLAGCGGAASDVTVAGRVPTTTTTSTAPPRATTTVPSTSRPVLNKRDADDLVAVTAVQSVFERGNRVGFGSLTSADFHDDITLFGSDETSTGPTSVSMVVFELSDGGPRGLAARSASGTCVWYGKVDNIEYIGTGAPCTGLAAIGNRHVVVPADSPWRLVFNDERIAAMLSAPPQWALESSVGAIRSYHNGAKTLTGVTAADLHANQRWIDFVEDKPSTDPRTVSFTVDGNRFAAAALADDGACYWIMQNFAWPDAARRGRGQPCTGTAALDAQRFNY